MTEVRFRVWSVNESKMVEPWDRTMVFWPSLRACEYDDDGKQFDIPLMQYTGLQDKNGADIYEGDIVRAEWTSNNSTIELVQWSEYDAGFELKGDHGIEESKLWLEIIGNIHESPELLK